ncbi:MAG: metallophosphoesterase [Dehalococcoidales bacterium]|nr:metallophosphoesterase [Dehalococcoidales bacterium]
MSVRRWFFWGGLFAAVLALGLMIFSLTMHGGWGLVLVNGIARIAFIIVALLMVFGVYLVLLENRRFARSSALPTPFLSASVRIFTCIALMFSIGGFFYIGDYLDDLPDTAPQLLMAEGNLPGGVPNMVVTFHTKLPTTNNLRWGDDSALLGTTTEAAPTQTHAFVLDGLQPEKVYWYRVNYGTVYSFRTPSLDSALKFAVVSDAHFGKKSSPVDQMNSMLGNIGDAHNNYGMLFSLGDLVDLGFRNEDWREGLQAFAQASATIPSVFVIGNHDGLFTGVNKYKNYDYPAGMPVTSGTQLWHRIDSGKIHFLILDVEWSAETITSAQKTWLTTQLQSIPREDWTIVMSHGFYYSSGYVTAGWQWYDNPATINSLTPLFEQYGVDMVFSGHNHQMEVLEKNKVTYVICGTFGGSIDPERTYLSPATKWYSVAEHAFVSVEIQGDTASLAFQNAEGNVLYSFTVKNK